MKFRAEYRRNGSTTKTLFYDSREDAQEALAKRIGHFHYLGKVSGDSHVPGQPCMDAPRNGGLVSIEAR